ncbi:MAG: DUF937 domain-containing protein, partial [Clostridia bacterium]|nr:DUF937 domain-containing protein [Clostridia bacterium]
MNDNFDLFKQLVGDDALKSISKKAKVTQKDVKNVISAAIPLMILGMHRNSSAEEGLNSLEKALANHAVDDTSDIKNFLDNADTEDGKKIVAHVLGDENQEVQKEIAKRAGLSLNKTSLIIALVAPLLLSLLGKHNNQQSSGTPGLLGALLHRLDIREHQLRADGLDVARRVHAAVHVDDVLVVEAAHHVEDRV